MEAAKHPRQAERLSELYSYGILDTDRERDFDEVVELAAEICGTAISVINIIDAERQWFKAEVGLGVRETPLATSICSHVILETDFVEINDTLKDRRMVDNPLCCSDPGLRFYAGALLKSGNGLPLGTLCVLDWKPMQLTDLQRKTLQVLANQVMAQLSLRRALADAELLRQEVDHRVKNSLQSIAALARATARAADSDDARRTIQSLESRISTVAEVHRQLHNAGNGEDIDLASFTDKLAENFRQMAPDNVEIVTDVEQVWASANNAASFGLLMNEFVTNSIKHAFPDERPGKISISVRTMPDGQVTGRFSDNGVGLNNSAAKSGGLGMKIAETVCIQLDCGLDIGNDGGGVTGTITFRPKQTEALPTG